MPFSPFSFTFLFVLVFYLILLLEWNQQTGTELYTAVCRSVGQLSGIALRDVTARYLTAIGRDAVIQSRNRTAGKDEIFIAEHSQPQVFFTAHNGKMISTRQGQSLAFQ